MADVVRFLFVMAVMSATAAICSASDVYVAATAAGANNGADCADAFAYNDPTHGVTVAGNQVGGVTYHLCGTFVGAAGAQLINVTGSGSAGNPFTIKFESGANLTAPYWSGYGAIGMFGVSWITIDGGTNGIIQNSANGSGLANAAQSTGIYIASSSNIVAKNLTIANMCQHTIVTDQVGCQTSGNNDAAIKVNNNGSAGSPITIINNTIHDAFVGIYIFANNGDGNFTVKNNTISRTNWTMNLGAGVGNSGPWDIENNDMSCVVGGPCNWTDNNNDFHHNGIIADFGNNVFMTGMVIANNYFHDINPCTAFTFLTPVVAGGSGGIPGVLIYNNVGFTSAGQSGPANAFFGAGPGLTGSIIVNNTIVGGDNTGGNNPIGLDGFNSTIKNNIVSTVQYGILLNTGFSGVVSDYNDIYNLSQGMQAGATFYGSLAAWRTGTGLDAHSINTNPNLTANFMLNAGSPAIGKGINLTGLGIPGLNVGAPQSFGAGGSCGTGCVARPSSGAWDMGAYPSKGTSVAGPNPPTTLSLTAH